MITHMALFEDRPKGATRCTTERRQGGAPYWRYARMSFRGRGEGGYQPLHIRKRNRSGLRRESQGFIVPIEIAGQHNPGRGKGPYPVQGRDSTLFTQPKSGGSGDCHVANHTDDDQDATEEALYQGQARTGLPLLRALRQGQPGRHTQSRLASCPGQSRESRR